MIKCNGRERNAVLRRGKCLEKKNRVRNENSVSRAGNELSEFSEDSVIVMLR